MEIPTHVCPWLHLDLHGGEVSVGFSILCRCFVTFAQVLTCLCSSDHFGWNALALHVFLGVRMQAR